MTKAAEVLRRTRLQAGLSRTALARRAGVPTSTVSRIEAARMDPTVTMLERLMEAAGRRLRLDSSPPEASTLSTLARLLESSSTDDELDWTMLRAFLDDLDQHPDRIARALSTAPRSGDRRLDALLAGIAEELADRADLARPRWTQTSGPLDQTWHAPGTSRMVEQARRRTPKPLRDRNIWIAAGALWHQP